MKLFNQLWEHALLYLKESLNEFQYNQLIKELKLLKREKCEFYFEVPNPALKNLVTVKYTENIMEAIYNAYGDIGEVPGGNIAVHFLSPSESAELIYEEETQSEEKKITDRNIPIDPEMTFDTFVVGECNRFANQMALNIAENPGGTYNPLFLYGGPSLGKTHLVQAIGNKILENNPKANIVYVTSETFMNDFISMLRNTNNKMDVDVREEFRNRYRNVDILLIDDIQFFEKKEAIQEEFFHTFNALHQHRKQIVITSDKPPRELKNVEERLMGRFEWGISVDIKPPDYETRVAILIEKSQKLKDSIPVTMPIENEVYHFIASRVASNIRLLEGALKKVILYAEMNKNALHIEKIDEKIAQVALEDSFGSAEPKKVNENTIIEAVCNQYGISVEDVKGKKRSKEIAFPRQVCMYIMRNVLEYTYPKIGEIFGRDHSTAMHAEDKVKEMMGEDKDTKNTVEDLIVKIKEY